VIHRIDTLDDPRLRSYRHTGDHAWLRRQHLFMVEGRLVVERLIRGRRFPVESVLITTTALKPLRSTLEGLDAPIYVVEAPALARVTGFNFHRGCLALGRRPGDASVEPILAGRLIVALEGVGNPDNVGGIFRTAAAFGATGILLDPTSADPYYRKAIRTSMGAVLQVPFARAADWPACLERTRWLGFQLVALTPAAAASVTLERWASTLARDDRLALILGTEGDGLSDSTLAVADVRVRIPTEPVVDSLNVVVAAGIVLSRVQRS